MNLRLIPATLLTGTKYAVSGLRVERLATDKVGDMANAPLASAQNTDSPYPLVSGKDLFGRNLIVPLTIKGKTDPNGMYFPEAVVNVSRSRTIVATPVINGKGTVKEMITDGDFELSISLAVVSTNDSGEFNAKAMPFFSDVYPDKGVEKLRRLLDEPNRLDVVSDFLKLFDLDGGEFGIVVKSYSVNQETHTNRQVFSITAVSDYDYNLLIEE